MYVLSTLEYWIFYDFILLCNHCTKVYKAVIITFTAKKHIFAIHTFDAIHRRGPPLPLLFFTATPRVLRTLYMTTSTSTNVK